jgi:hypothetical protein
MLPYQEKKQKQMGTHIVVDPYTVEIAAERQRSRMLKRKCDPGKTWFLQARLRAFSISSSVRACLINVQYHRRSDMSSSKEPELSLTLVCRLSLRLLHLTMVSI